MSAVPLVGSKSKPRPGFCSLLFHCSCLESGVVWDEQDKFKRSKTEFHEFGHDLRMQSEDGLKVFKMMDEFLAVVIVGIPLLYNSITVLGALGSFLMDIWESNLNSLALIMFANTLIEFMIVAGVAMMWHTLCYWSDGALTFWSWKMWPLPPLMSGGFMPRMAAFSLGVLMFTTSTLVSEGRVTGADLAKKFHHDSWQYCRATDMAAQHAPWYGRLLTRPPVVTGDFHCFNAHFRKIDGYRPGMINVTTFTEADIHDFYDNTTFELKDHSHTRGFIVPSHNGTDLGKSPGFPFDLLVNWGLADESHFHAYEFQCMYQCCKWKPLSWQPLIKNAGTLVAGSAVVVKTTDMISKNFGGYFFTWFAKKFGSKGYMIGLPLITPETTADTISKVVDRTISRPGKGRSKFFAALVCLLATAPLRVASKIDSNGYYTVDYYVTAVFLSSLVMALVLRQWHPYKMTRIAYTQDLWLKGEDSFIDVKECNHKNINLYEWLHIDQASRAEHLLAYARKLTMDDIDAGIKSQKKLAKMDEDFNAELKGNKVDGKKVTTKKDEFETFLAGMTKNVLRKLDETNQAPGKQDENQASKKRDETNQATKEISPESDYQPLAEHQHMQRQIDPKYNPYFNKYANLLVKTIAEISAVHSTPPIKEENATTWKVTAGISISRCFTLRENSIGTVVGRLDGNRVMVRFPVKCPANAPTHEKEKIQIHVAHQPYIDPDHEPQLRKFMREAQNQLIATSTKPFDDEKKGEEAEKEKAAKKDAEEKRKVAQPNDGDFEDVPVSLEQLMEANMQWVHIQSDEIGWHKEQARQSRAEAGDK